MTNEEIIKKKHIGRKLITETYVTEAKIIEVYRRTHSMRKAGEELGIAYRTVFKYVNRAKMSYPVGASHLDDPLAEMPNNNAIAKILDDLGCGIPRDVHKIRLLVGNRFPISSIYYFLKTRRKYALDVLMHLGSLLDKPTLILKDIYGRSCSVGSVAQYELDVDRYNLTVTINATLKFGGKIICRMSFEAYKNIFGDNAP